MHARYSDVIDVVLYLWRIDLLRSGNVLLYNMKNNRRLSVNEPSSVPRASSLGNYNGVKKEMLIAKMNGTINGLKLFTAKGSFNVIW